MSRDLHIAAALKPQSNYAGPYTAEISSYAPIPASRDSNETPGAIPDALSKKVASDA